MLRERGRPGLPNRGLKASTSGGGFTPASIPNLGAWYDSSDTASVAQSGGLVSQWNDKSGNARHLTQATGARQPTFTSGAAPTAKIAFDGTTDVMTCPDYMYDTAAGVTVFMAASVPAQAGERTFLGESDASQSNSQISRYALFRQGGGGAGDNTYCQTEMYKSSLDFPYVATKYANFVMFSGAGTIPDIYTFTDTTTFLHPRRNGADATVAQPYTRPSVNPTTPTVFNVGSQLLSTGPVMSALMSAHEIIVVQRICTAAEVNQVEQYLATKWSASNYVAASATPLRVIGVNNTAPVGTITNATRGQYYFRLPHIIGQNASAIRLSFDQWYMTNSGDTNAGNGYTITDVSIESPSAAVFPVLFSGGRTQAIANGDVNIMSDSLAGTFVQGEKYYIKGRITMTAGQNLATANLPTAVDAGMQSGWYDSGSTTLSSTDAAGVYTFTGTAPATLTQVICPFLLGTVVTDSPSFVGTGDSIMAGFGDDNTAGVCGGGFFSRSMRNAANNGGYLPSMKFALTGIGINNVGSKCKTYYKYARYAVDELGTNDANGGASLATLQSRINTHWGNLYGSGIERIYRTQLMTATTSADNWATVALQTYSSVPIWGPAGIVENFNSWAVSVVGPSIYSAPRFNSVMDGVDPRKWVANGTPFYVTVDGTHQSPTGAELSATDLRPVLRA